METRTARAGKALGPRTGDVLELRIDALAAGGDGVGRSADGRVVFVPLTAPGDRVLARLEMLRPRYARAELVRVLEPGPGRVTPRCPVFGVCGGCSWQHVDSAVQHEAKRRIVEDALTRLAHLELPGPVTLVPSPFSYGYRARTRVAVESGEVGFRRRRSRALCAVHRCPVLTPETEAELAALAGSPPARDGEWEIAAGTGGVRGHARGTPAPPIEVVLNELPLRVSAGVFFQANPGLHATLIDAVARAAGSGALAIELFAGVGFFTRCLARCFERVIAIEADPIAALDLRENLARAGHAHAEVVEARVEVTLSEGSFYDLRPDVVVLDPPRAGLAPGVAEALSRLAPERVVYLSCDPATLARDLAALVSRGLVLEGVEAFDLFPQTPHVEVLARGRFGVSPQGGTA